MSTPGTPGTAGGAGTYRPAPGAAGAGRGRTGLVLQKTPFRAHLREGDVIEVKGRKAEVALGRICAQDLMDESTGEILLEVKVVDLGSGSRIGFLAPGVLALAVLSTAFTAQAIGTGFERRYGVLKRLGSTPLPRWALLAGKATAVLAIEVGQLVLLGAVAAALGWRPSVRGWAAALLLIVLATAAFSGLALLVGGNDPRGCPACWRCCAIHTAASSCSATICRLTARTATTNR